MGMEELNFNQAGNVDGYLRYGQSWAPLFLENVKANAAVAIDIRVKNLGAKRDLEISSSEC